MFSSSNKYEVGEVEGCLRICISNLIAICDFVPPYICGLWVCLKGYLALTRSLEEWNEATDPGLNPVVGVGVLLLHL